jgi:hypothetical protein
MACCCFAKETGGGGGAVFATTGRFASAAGGFAAAAAPEPITACRAGATGGVVAATGADATSLWFTATLFLETDCAEVKACGVVAVTAPGTL